MTTGADILTEGWRDDKENQRGRQWLGAFPFLCEDTPEFLRIPLHPFAGGGLVAEFARIPPSRARAGMHPCNYGFALRSKGPGFAPIFSQESSERLPCREPLSRNGGVAGDEGDDAADDGAGGVAVAEAGDGGPEGFGVVVEVAGGAPEGEGDGVPGDDFLT